MFLLSSLSTTIPDEARSTASQFESMKWKRTKNFSSCVSPFCPTPKMDRAHASQRANRRNGITTRGIEVVSCSSRIQQHKDPIHCRRFVILIKVRERAAPRRRVEAGNTNFREIYARPFFLLNYT